MKIDVWIFYGFISQLYWRFRSLGRKNFQKMQERQALRRLANPERRDRILDEFNRDQMDDVGLVGGEEQGMKLLSEMNELGEAQEQIIRDGVSKINHIQSCN